MIQLYIHVYIHFILFQGWVIFHCICEPCLLYPFLCQWTLRLLPCLGYYNNAAVKIGVHVSFLIRIFIFSWYMPRSGIAGWYGNSTFREKLTLRRNLVYWSIVNLQYCVNFCSTAQWVSYIYILFHLGLITGCCMQSPVL